MKKGVSESMKNRINSNSYQRLKGKRL